jgi:hypothetical protein
MLEAARTQYPDYYKKRAKMAKKPALTTNDLGLLLGLSTHAIIKAFDNGTIPGFTVPLSTHRRISKEGARKLLSEQFEDPAAYLDVVELHLTNGHDVPPLKGSKGIVKCADSFELGAKVLEHTVNRIVVAEECVQNNAKLLAERVRVLCEERGYPVPEVDIIPTTVTAPPLRESA